MAEDRLFQLKIISPDKVFFEGEAVMVEMPTTEGMIGVYKNHIPLTVILKPGTLIVTQENDVRVAAIHSGFVEILKDKVTILAEAIEWPEDIDINRAKRAKERAEKRLKDASDEINTAKAEAALMRAMTRLEVAKK